MHLSTDSQTLILMIVQHINVKVISQKYQYQISAKIPYIFLLNMLSTSLSIIIWQALMLC